MCFRPCVSSEGVLFALPALKMKGFRTNFVKKALVVINKEK